MKYPRCSKFLFAGIIFAWLTLIGGSLRAGNISSAKELQVGQDAPLPSAVQLEQRVLKNLKKSQAERERYICRTNVENDVTDKNGRVKRSQTKQYDVFFVNGQEVDRLTGKNGKPLSTGRQKKEMERVQKQIQKDSDMQYVARKDAENKKQLEVMLRMLRFVNGRRVDLRGRSTLIYDLSGDPDVHPHSTEETLVHAMSGTIQVDEATGELMDLSARLNHDVKIGGGLLANLHKGFWIHVRQQRHPDGVWLPDLIEGNGDARAVLFFHPYFKFKQTMNGCVLTSVETMEGDARKADTQEKR